MNLRVPLGLAHSCLTLDAASISFDLPPRQAGGGRPDSTALCIVLSGLKYASKSLQGHRLNGE